MLNPNKPKSTKGPGGAGREFSLSQRVVGICAILVYGLICFLVGVLVGRHDPSFDTRQTAAAVKPKSEVRPLPPPAPRSEPRGEQTSPQPVIMPTSAPPVRPAADAGAPEAPTRTPRITERPAPPKEPAQGSDDTRVPEKQPEGVQPRRDSSRNGPPTDKGQRPAPKNEKPPGHAKTAPEAPEKPVANDARPDAGKPVAQGPAKPKDTQPPAPSKKPEVAGPPKGEATQAGPQAEPRPGAATPSTTQTPGETSPAASAEDPEPSATPPAAKGAYVIQVASFSSSNRAQAEDARRRLSAHANLTAELVTSEDGKYVRVIVGNYPDLKTAEKARDALRERKGFADCFVRRR